LLNPSILKTGRPVCRRRPLTSSHHSIGASARSALLRVRSLALFGLGVMSDLGPLWYSRRDMEADQDRSLWELHRTDDGIAIGRAADRYLLSGVMQTSHFKRVRTGSDSNVRWAFAPSAPICDATPKHWDLRH